MIEAINSSLRDNIARMNRKSKRYSKKEDLLYGTIQLFFHYKTYNGGFFKNKKYVENNKWTVCLSGGMERYPLSGGKRYPLSGGEWRIFPFLPPFVRGESVVERFSCPPW